MSNWAAFMAKASGGRKPDKPKSPAVRPQPITKPLLPTAAPAPVPAAINSPTETTEKTALDLLDLRTRTSADVAIRSSTPPSAAASTPAWVEAARLQAVRELGDLFRKQCDALGGRKHFAHFETWLWAARGESGQLDGVVPPIPVPHPGSSARAELIRKLLRAGQSEANATTTCDALDARCALLLARVHKAAGSTTDSSPRPRARLVDGGGASAEPGEGVGSASGKKKRKRSDGDGTAASEPGGQRQDPSGSGEEEGEVRRVRLACGGVEVLVTEHHLDKLRQLFSWSRAAAATAAGGAAVSSAQAASAPQSNVGVAQLSKRELKQQRKQQRAAAAVAGEGAMAPAGGVPSDEALAGHDEAAFVDAAFGVLTRLMCLQGGHDNAGGMQGACPPGVFDALRADFGVTMECFASPLNARFPRFCSAAADVDAAFGSRGSFFSFRPESGAFLANPPFEPGIVSRMAQHMGGLLESADAGGGVLLFVVVIPAWPDQPCWQALKGSAHCTATLRLPKSKHAYLDGGQHHGRRAVPLRLSNHDSSVFFLMSSKASALSPLNFNKERRLREAFTGGLKVQGALHK